MQTDNECNPINSIATTRVMDQDGIWRLTARDNRMAHMHDDIETISKKIADRKHIIYSEFEAREV